MTFPVKLSILFFGVDETTKVNYLEYSKFCQKFPKVEKTCQLSVSPTLLKFLLFSWLTFPLRSMITKSELYQNIF